MFKYKMVIPPIKKNYPNRYLEIREGGGFAGIYETRELSVPDNGGELEIEVEYKWFYDRSDPIMDGFHTFIALVEKDKDNKKEELTLLVPERM